MENVEGLMLGSAYSYVLNIYRDFEKLGYRVKHWLLTGETMGVPQRRHRVVFVAVRNDIEFDLGSLSMNFNYSPVTYGEIKCGEQTPLAADSKFYNIAKQATDEDMCIADTRRRLGQKPSAFQTAYIRDNIVLPTMRSRPDWIDMNTLSHVSKESLRNSQTFPQDYKFIPNTYSTVGYICGMSVPPLMIQRVVTRLIESGLYDYRLSE